MMRIDCTSESLTELTLDDLVFAIDSGYWKGDTELIVALNIVSLFSDSQRKSQFKKQFREYTGESLYNPRSTANLAFYAAITFEELVILTACITKQPLVIVRGNLEKWIHNSRFFQSKTFYSLPIQHRKLVYTKSNLKTDCNNQYYLWDYSYQHTILVYTEQSVKENLMYHELNLFKKGAYKGVTAIL